MGSRSASRDRALSKGKRRSSKTSSGSSLFGYTDEENPFGDSALTNVFVWNKKHKKEIGSGSRSSMKKLEKKLKRRQLELRDEIQRVKDRKEEREVEKEQMEEMKTMMAREMENEMNANWDLKEEEFHREQGRIRVAKRMNERRETPCDVLASNLLILHHDELKAKPKGHSDSLNDLDGMSFDLVDPVQIFKGLNKHKLEGLLEDIRAHCELGDHVDYWNALEVVCIDELTSSSAATIDPVRADLQTMFEAKSSSALVALKSTAQHKVSGVDSSSSVVVDVDYWHSLLPLIDVAIARAFLREFFADLLRQRVHHLTTDRRTTTTTTTTSNTTATATTHLSPIAYWDEGDDEVAVDEEEDRQRLSRERRRVLMEQWEMMRRDQSRITAATTTAAEASGRMELMAQGQMGEDEQSFDDLVQLPAQEMVWAHDYSPRKPRFFNSVKTGFEWSKYNQTHYDRDNPPPKVVQGYKFNLFYPDLIDRTNPPTFTKQKISSDPNFCVLRFSAGPPYQDIAFKIVNKPWESSQRHGFRCKFERGILHLYFNFRRIRYRR